MSKISKFLNEKVEVPKKALIWAAAVILIAFGALIFNALLNKETIDQLLYLISGR